MTERVDERESGDFFLNVLRKLLDPFLELAYFRENRPVFFYEPFDQWFVFGYDDVANLFPDPDRFDISRKPGRYLSFGFGPHGCLGAPLAIEETRIALETLFRRMPDIRFDESKEIEWHRNAANCGPAVLPLTLDAPRTGAPGLHKVGTNAPQPAREESSMALALGSGPFGKQSTGTFNFEVNPPRGHALYFEDCPKRVRAVFGGETVVDSHSVKLLHETGHLPVYYFPEEDLRGDLLEPTDHTTHCPFKGEASYRSVRVEDRIAEYAVWTYPEPLEDAPPILGYVALYHDAMDKWLEEDKEVFGHPHDPYHRVDVLESSRHVRVSLNGEVVAYSTLQ